MYMRDRDTYKRLYLSLQDKYTIMKKGERLFQDQDNIREQDALLLNMVLDDFLVTHRDVADVEPTNADIIQAFENVLSDYLK